MVLLEDYPRLICGHDVALGLPAGVVREDHGHSSSLLATEFALEGGARG
jgi:hypothetical protein